MKILSWNSRGLKNPCGIRALCDFVKKEVPDVLLLQETKLVGRHMGRTKFEIGFDNCLTIDYEGHSSGLCLMWRHKMSLTICSFSKHHIDALVCKEGKEGQHSQLTGIFEHPETSRSRPETWELLRILNNGNHNGLLVFRDFNEILSRNEKSGRKDRPE